MWKKWRAETRCLAGMGEVHCIWVAGITVVRQRGSQSYTYSIIYITVHYSVAWQPGGAWESQSLRPDGGLT